MEEKNRRIKKLTMEWKSSSTPKFIQKWFYGPYQSLTNEQICAVDPVWLSEAISQEIMNGKIYFAFDLQKLSEINPDFSITLEAERVIAARQANWDAQVEEEKKEKERVKDLMAERALKYHELDKETKAAHLEEIVKLVGPWFKPFRSKLESGKYEGYTPVEVLEKHPQDVMEAFSKAIVDYYHFPHERLLERIKDYCPDFKLSDEAALIYKYEREAHEVDLAQQESLNELAYEEYMRDMADSYEEASEGSSEDYDDRLDLDQQHPDFYQG